MAESFEPKIGEQVRVRVEGRDVFAEIVEVTKDERVRFLPWGTWTTHTLRLVDVKIGPAPQLSSAKVLAIAAAQAREAAERAKARKGRKIL